jgi:hypothetical protein
MYPGPRREVSEVARVREGVTWRSAVEILEVDEEGIAGFRQGAEVLPGEHSLWLGYRWTSLLLDRSGNPVGLNFAAEAGRVYEVRGERRSSGARWRPQVVDVTESLENRQLRPPTVAVLGGAVLLYPVNRLLDLLDVGRANVSVGLGSAALVHPTRAFQLGLGGLFGLRTGWQGRRFPIKLESEAGAAISVFAAHHRDFFEIAVLAHLLVVGIEVAFDPVEVADLLGGLLLIDFARDDISARPPLSGPVVARAGGE